MQQDRVGEYVSAKGERVRAIRFSGANLEECRTLCPGIIAGEYNQEPFLTIPPPNESGVATDVRIGDWIIESVDAKTADKYFWMCGDSYFSMNYEEREKGITLPIESVSLSIGRNAAESEVLINGKKVEGVTKVTIEYNADNPYPRVILEVLSPVTNVECPLETTCRLSILPSV